MLKRAGKCTWHLERVVRETGGGSAAADANAGVEDRQVTLEHWQEWQAQVQVRQMFCMPPLVVGELKRTAEISRQRFHSKWTPCYREVVVSRAAGSWSTPRMVGTRNLCPAMCIVR
jgi:hypothetical protein